MVGLTYYLDDVVDLLIDLFHRKAARSEPGVGPVELALGERLQGPHPLGEPGVAGGDLRVLAEALLALLVLVGELLNVELGVELGGAQRELGERAGGDAEVLRAEETGAVAGDLGAALPAGEGELGRGDDPLEEDRGHVLEVEERGQVDDVAVVDVPGLVADHAE